MRLLGMVNRRPIRIVIGLVVAGLIAFRLYLPTLVKNHLNGVLASLPDYRGHVDDVRIHLWRSAYSMIGMRFVKTDGQVPVPFFSASDIDFSLHWAALFRGQLVGKVMIDKPQLNFVEANSSAQKQTSIDKSWQQQVKSLFPLRVSRLRIKDGEIHFRNFQAKPEIDISLHRVNALATNLTNSRKVSSTLKATLDATGVLMSDGNLVTHVEIDPLADKPTFKGILKLEGLDLRELNDFFNYYLAVEVKDGTFSYYMEGAAKEGQFIGYAKPLLDHLDFIKVKENPSLSEAAKALVVKFVSYLMKNHINDRLATRIPISGTVDNPKTGTWSAIASFFGNWLIRAIPHGLDRSVSFESVP